MVRSAPTWGYRYGIGRRDPRGPFCVVDRKPRQWCREQIAALTGLAAAAAKPLEREELAATAAGDKEIEHLKSELLMTVAHDLAQPLQVVKSLAQLLRRRLAGGAGLDRDVVDAALAQIETGAQRIAAEVAEMLGIGQAGPGWRPMLRYGSADLVEVARQAVAAHQGSSPAHAIALATDEAELVGIVDAARVRGALDNVLDNAIKYSPAGGAVILTLEREDAADGPVTVIAVRDRGIGVPAADVPRLAERFFRASNAVGAFPGTGIGLAGVRQAVEAHCGKLTIDSTESVGTVVTLRLPLTLGLAREEPPRRTSSDQSGRGTSQLPAGNEP
jgi:signal transduction histidine kinase